VNNFAAPYCFLGNYLQDHRPQFGNLQKYTAKVGQDHWIFISFVINYHYNKKNVYYNEKLLQ